MTIARKDFEDVLVSNDRSALRRLLEGQSEDQRAVFAPVAISAYKKAFRDHWSKVQFPLNAVLSTATSSQLQKLTFPFIHIDTLDMELLTSLRPSTLETWVHGRIADRRITYECVAKLIESGLCTRPDTDDYIVFMMASYPSVWFTNSPKSSDTTDKQFIKHYVWRLFEVEGNSENSLAAHDKYSAANRTWEYLLLELSQSGNLPRERLLDASLQALDRGFIQFRSGWYSRFHEALKPTIEERIARTHAYAQLLGSSIPPTVTFAIDALKEIDTAESLSSELLLQHIEPVLLSKAKSTVKGALSLIEHAMTRDPAKVNNLCLIALRGLTHDSPDVQAQILKLLGKVPGGIDDTIRMELAQYEDSLASSLQSKLSDLLLKSSVGVSHVPASFTLKSKTLHAMYTEQKQQLPNPLETNARLIEFETIDQVIAGCSYSLEHPNEVIEIERALQGILRLSPQLPPDFISRSAALKKRALHFAKARSESVTMLNRKFAAFVGSWLTASVSPHINQLRSDAVPAERFIHRRFDRLLNQIIACDPLPEFCASTHERGFIDPTLLLERWHQRIAAGRLPGDEDQAIALLRIPLAHLPALLPEYVDVPGEFWDACRFATGYTDTKGSGESQLWAAADAYRNPVVSTAILDLGDGPIWMQPHDLDLLRALHDSYPSLRNQFVASGLRRLGSMIEGSWQLDRCARAYIEPMLDQSFQFDRNSYHALACGLIIAEPAFVGIARDILIQLIELDRLSIEQLGKELGVFIYCGTGKAKRMTASLWDVARVGEKHSSATRQLLERALQGGEVVPREMSVYLELLNELLHAEGLTLTNPVTRAHLESIKAGGKAAKLIRDLLKAESADII